MIKVILQAGDSSTYWAVCETVSLCDRAGAYVLSSVMEDSKGRGPLAWVKTAAGWQVLTVREV